MAVLKAGYRVRVQEVEDVGDRRAQPLDWRGCRDSTTASSRSSSAWREAERKSAERPLVPVVLVGCRGFGAWASSRRREPLPGTPASARSSHAITGSSGDRGSRCQSFRPPLAPRLPPPRGRSTGTPSSALRCRRLCRRSPMSWYRSAAAGTVLYMSHDLACLRVRHRWAELMDTAERWGLCLSSPHTRRS